MSEKCAWCDTLLPAVRRSSMRFCDKHCAAAHQQQKWRTRNPKSALGALLAGGVAEVNEMRVAIDLLQRGFEVYRAAFQGMPCDMLVRRTEWDHNQVWRVEVTTGNRTVAGSIVHPDRSKAQFDVLAVVLADGEIMYKPDIGEEQVLQ